MELHGPNYPEPPSEIVEGDPEFEVKQIVGSRRVGKKKTLQYKIRWKGYSPAHDSWELAKQVYTLELIKQFQKTKSSRKNNATINCQAASGILSRPSSSKQPWGYSSLPKVESFKLNEEIDKGSAFGKRTQGSPTTQMENNDRRSSSNNDKREDQDLENIIIVPLFFHINSCIMSNNVDQFIPDPDNNDPPPPLTQTT
jgi:hypothetical protein